MTDMHLTGTCHCGATGWTFDGDPGGATACNCTVDRRYGALWIYDYLNEGIRLRGDFSSYVRADRDKPFLEWLSCPACTCIVAWRALNPGDDGKTRAAVNVRLADPDQVGDLPIDHFDGLDTFEDLPRDGRRVRDIWF